MMRSNPDQWFKVLCGLLLTAGESALAFEAPECRTLELEAYSYSGPAIYDQGLLWKLTGKASRPSYLFGTIHVTDSEILDLPGPVTEALAGSSIFVMETLPDIGQLSALSELLFFQDGRTLRQMISQPLFERTGEILRDYYLPSEAVASMKPWAAFLTMNYPPGAGTVLDEMLMNLAVGYGASVHGLESMQEQLDIFDDLPLENQVTLLADTVCHYEVIIDDIATMKSMYLARDLKGLYEYSNRYSYRDDPVYEELMNNLLTRRNHVMVERMLPHLEAGNAFIAIGAMHLPGDEGILNLLRERGYELIPVY